MPRKRRHDKRSRTITREVRTYSLTMSAWLWHWGSDKAGREAWEWLKDAPGWPPLNPGFRPAPFWAYTPGVPEELREEPERLDPRPILSPRVTDEYRDALRDDEQEHERFKAARVQWLDENGLLSRHERKKFGLGDPDVAA